MFNYFTCYNHIKLIINVKVLGIINDSMISLFVHLFDT